MRRGLPILVLSLAALARADDKKAVVVAAPDESVSSARSDLELIKRGAGSNPGDSKLPSLSAPDLSSGASAYVPSYNAPQDPTKKLTKDPNANWLVDGVMGNKKADLLKAGPPKTKEEERAAILKESLQQSSKSEKAESDDYKIAEDAKGAPAEAKAPEFKADNPLNVFMSSWVSNGDQQLLKSTSGPKDSPLPGGAPTPADPASLGLLVSTGPGPTSAPAPANLKPLDNPFLNFVNSPVVATPPPEVTYRPAPTTPPPPDPAPVVNSASRGTIPDYAKGLQDDPALKQAKRF